RFALRSFSRDAVPGSMTRRTSVASWLTLVPTSLAPIRITMLLGSRGLAWPLTAAGLGGLCAPTWVLFFVRRLAMVVGVGGKSTLECALGLLLPMMMQSEL